MQAKTLRKNRNLSIKQLAELLELTPGNIQNLENGKKIATDDIIDKYMEVFNHKEEQSVILSSSSDKNIDDYINTDFDNANSNQGLKLIPLYPIIDPKIILDTFSTCEHYGYNFDPSIISAASKYVKVFYSTIIDYRKEYKIKDYVVYPKHGVGKIVAVEKAKIGSIDINFYKVFIEKEKLTLSIPLNQQSHLRHVSSINQINKAITILKNKPKIKRTMWSRRAQEYEQKINSGKLYQLAEVVKDLNKKTDVIAEQSYSERQLFEKAYERLKSEFEVVLGEKAKIKMNKALNRVEQIAAIA